MSHIRKLIKYNHEGGRIQRRITDDIRQPNPINTLSIHQSVFIGCLQGRKNSTPFNLQFQLLISNYKSTTCSFWKIQKQKKV